MKKVFLILLTAFPLCFADAHKDTIYDTIMVKQTVIDTIHKVVADSVTVKALESSQLFYSTAFESLLFKISIGLCIIGILVAIVGIFLGIIKSNKEREFEETNEKISNLKKEWEYQIKDQRIKFNNMKNDFENKIEKLRKDHDKELEDIKVNLNLKKKKKHTDENKEKPKDGEKEEQKKKTEYVKNVPDASDYEKDLAEAAKYYNSDDYKSALESYETILKNYGDKITLTHLSQIYYYMAYSYDEIAQSGKNENKETMLIKAIDKYKQILEWNPKDVDTYYNFGYTLMNLAEAKTEMKEKERLLLEAIDKYNQTLELNPEEVDAYHNLGSALIRLRRLKNKTEEKEDLLNKAEKVCLKSRDLKGDVYNLACVYAIKYDLTKKPEHEDKAFEYLEKSLEKEEQSFDCIENDPDFVSLRDDIRYKKLKEKYGKK